MPQLVSRLKRKVRHSVAESRFPFPSYMRRHHCIFVHVPKTAGTSLRTALGAPRTGRQHLPWWVYEKASPARFASYFSFAFVRHPAERLYSAYRYLLEGGNQMDDLAIAESVRACGGFEEFIETRVANGFLASHPLFWPQAFFVADHFGQIRVDFVGRVETIDSDFETVRRRLGLSSGLPRENMNEAPQSPGLSPDIRARIRLLYPQDHDLFGYE